MRILSYDPLITVSGCEVGNVFIRHMAQEFPDVFGQKFGLHFLLPTWNLEGNRAKLLQGSISTASESLPGHIFVVISSVEYEAFLLGQAGVAALFANQSMFVDERVWKLAEPIPGNKPAFDVAFNARFDKMKRHNLATELENLLLIYSYCFDASVTDATTRIKEILPKAYYANHELNAGKYAHLTPAQITRLYDVTDVGLCLSAEEGICRASIEYLLCGLPVVSTYSIGGRDRYYSKKYCRVVAPEPRAIATAVNELKACNFSKQEVRDQVLADLHFDRQNFLRAANRVVEHFTRLKNYFGSIDPFLGVEQMFYAHDKIVEDLKLELTTIDKNNL